ncbi:MAG: hypothetical protein IPL54_04765 [Chitinophagaceae bacterium]|nr:hypothetical protein [Chitinophagaceae bacterium]
MDYVDSLILHNPLPEYLDGNRNDHYELLEQLKQRKIKAYGASLDTFKEIETFTSNYQQQSDRSFFNLFHQDAARAFDLAKEKMWGSLKIPLDSGWLTGKYNEHSIFNDIRKRWSKSDIRTRAVLVNSVKRSLALG